MKIHEYAKLVPPMDPAEFAELVADVKANGLLDPITIHEGEILDGVHRSRACELLEIEPRYETFSGKDPLGWVLSKNLHRRHLNPGQRAVILLEAGRVSPPRGGDEIGTSSRTMERVQAIAARAPDLIDEIRLDKTSASIAYEILRVREFEDGKPSSIRKAAADLLEEIEAGKIGARQIAGKLAAAEVAYRYGDPGRVGILLNVQYDRNVHSAELEETSQKYRSEAHERELKRRQNMKWDDVPEVAKILRSMRAWKEAIPEFEAAVEVGKLAPEAERFLTVKIGEIIGEVSRLLKRLEDLRDKLRERSE